MAKKEPKSVRVVLPNWKSSRAHRAQESMACAGYGCGRTIEKGDLYTRQKPAAASYYYSVHAFCRVCVPFIEQKMEYGMLHDAYLVSDFGQEDERICNEKYGHQEVFGASAVMSTVNNMEDDNDF